MKQDSVLEKLAAEANAAGADTLEVEYKDGIDEVCAMTGNAGCNIACFRVPARRPPLCARSCTKWFGANDGTRLAAAIMFYVAYVR